ncbi:MAG: TonB-dependent receptor [Thermodesulfobacteriota bacterium]|nr:TonB-dependent receptor [Thermodesulfobacteriota bacterium]
MCNKYASQIDQLRASIRIFLGPEFISTLLISMITVLLWATETEAEQDLKKDLTAMSIEELMDMEITSAGKKPQKLCDAAAAVFVITQEDIRRCGATSIPEALRMVPGVQVARIDANKWAITSRGFNGRFANKLLVLIDGRSVYTSLYSGVFWEVQDTLLEDIERIEVIRGPGATLWGANAVNGVINIITKHSRKTQATLLTAGLGTEEEGFGAFRHGSKWGENSFYRVYAKYFSRDDAVDAYGASMTDGWEASRGGFRIDWGGMGPDSLTLQGDIYDVDAEQRSSLPSLTAPFEWTFDEEVESSGGNLLFRWDHIHSDSSNCTMQLYYDHTTHKEVLTEIHNDIFDMEFQHRFELVEQQEIIWGAGYRHLHDRLKETFYLSLSPDSRDDNLYSAFIQGETFVIKDLLRLTIGSKFEYNDYTGFEYQPSGRILWVPNERHSMWGAVSRAVRTPSRVEHDGTLLGRAIGPFMSENPTPLTALSGLTGNQDFESEELLAYELGYRVRATDSFSIDVAAFYNDYDDLRTIKYNMVFIDNSGGQPYIFVPVNAENKMDGSAYGLELAIDWRARSWLHIQPAYTYLKMNLNNNGDTRDTFSEVAEGESPRHQFSLRFSIDLPGSLELDLWSRYIDDLPQQNIDSYINLDARLGWKPRKDIELSIVGQNLIDSHHPEFIPEILDTSPTEVERSVYGKITWRF